MLHGEHLTCVLIGLRAWHVAGHAIRHAIAAGLHLEVLMGSPSTAKFATAQQLWSSLFRLDVMLAEITGRPRFMRDLVPLQPQAPLDLSINSEKIGPHNRREKEADTVSVSTEDDVKDGDQTMSSSPSDHGSGTGETRLPQPDLSIRLAAFTALCQQSTRISDTLYSKQSEQYDLARFMEDLESSISRPVRSTKDDPSTESAPKLPHDVAMYQHSLRMILYRPFLQGEGANSDTYRQQAVAAALALVQDLIPEDIPTGTLPFLLVHYLCQAGAVLLLDLRRLSAPPPDHPRRDLSQISRELSALNKAMNDLSTLSATSRSAFRAWSMYRALCARLSMKLGPLADDFDNSVLKVVAETLDAIPTRVPRLPVNWSSEEEFSLQLDVAQNLSL